MYERMVPISNKSAIVNSVGLVSTTKDSVHVKWNIDDLYSPMIDGYKIDYQADGSSIQQFTDIITDGKRDFELSQLHENTYYKICVNVITNHSYMIDRECVKATTAVDSLSVALGSTFGAFLGLGFVVLCVFLAKWTQMRKLKYQLKHMKTNPDDIGDKSMQTDDEIEMSDVSLHVNDASIKASTLSSKSSHVSGFSDQEEPYENGAISGAELMLDDKYYEEDFIDDDLLELGMAESLQYANGNTINDIPVDINCPEHSIELYEDYDNQSQASNESLNCEISIESNTNFLNSDNTELENSSPQHNISLAESIPNSNNEVKVNSYGGARPKQYAKNSLTDQHQNLIELHTSDPLSTNTIHQCPDFKW